jgi:hypothetical protein
LHSLPFHDSKMFLKLADVGKFMFLLTSHDLDICKVVILDVSNMYLVNQSMKQNL